MGRGDGMSLFRSPHTRVAGCHAEPPTCRHLLCVMKRKRKGRNERGRCAVNRDLKRRAEKHGEGRGQGRGGARVCQQGKGHWDQRARKTLRGHWHGDSSMCSCRCRPPGTPSDHRGGRAPSQPSSLSPPMEEQSPSTDPPIAARVEVAHEKRWDGTGRWGGNGWHCTCNWKKRARVRGRSWEN